MTGKPFVDPGFFIRVVSPVDQVLKLVRQRPTAEIGFKN